MDLQLIGDYMMLWGCRSSDTHVLARMFAAAMEGWMNAERCMLLLNVLESSWMFLNVLECSRVFLDALECSWMRA
jgi:hypothetical protein